MQLLFLGTAFKTGINLAGPFSHTLCIHIVILNLDGASSQN